MQTRRKTGERNWDQSAPDFVLRIPDQVEPYELELEIKYPKRKRGEHRPELTVECISTNPPAYTVATTDGHEWEVQTGADGELIIVSEPDRSEGRKLPSNREALRAIRKSQE